MANQGAIVLCQVRFDSQLPDSCGMKARDLAKGGGDAISSCLEGSREIEMYESGSPLTFAGEGRDLLFLLLPKGCNPHEPATGIARW